MFSSKDKGSNMKQINILRFAVFVLVSWCVLFAPTSPANAEAIHDAIRADDANEVKRLLSAGVDISVKDNFGQTPLHWATLRDNIEIAALLISNGADVNVKGGLLGLTPLHTATTDDKIGIAAYLISRGADVNAKDKLGQTPLHWAASMGRTDIAVLLISKGADVNARDNKDQTPLSLAEEKSHKELVDLLRKYGGL